MRNIPSKLELGAEDFECVAHIVLLHADGETERAETLHEKTALPSALLAFPISIAINHDDLPRQARDKRVRKTATRPVFPSLSPGR